MTKLQEREKENILAQTGRVRFLGMNIFNGTENLMSNNITNPGSIIQVKS
jgi:hypothetical protein